MSKTFSCIAVRALFRENIQIYCIVRPLHEIYLTDFPKMRHVVPQRSRVTKPHLDVAIEKHWLKEILK